MFLFVRQGLHWVLAATLTVVLLVLPASADRAENNHFKRNLNNVIKKPASNLQRLRTKKKKAVKKEQVQKIRKKRVRKRRPLRRKVVKKRQTGPTDDWWKNVANPAIEAFRDCVVNHATELAGSGAPVSTDQFVRQLLEPACSAERDDMVAKLKKTLGETEYVKVTNRLVDDVFVPAVVASVNPQSDEEEEQPVDKAADATPPPEDRPVKASVEANPPAVVPQPVVVPQPASAVAAVPPPASKPSPIGRNNGLEVLLRRAKAIMFACFRQKADYLAAHNADAKSEHIARAVIQACGQQTDQFFVHLHKLFHASDKEQQARKLEAIEQTYKPAIVRRIEFQRRAANVPADPADNRVATGSE